MLVNFKTVRQVHIYQNLNLGRQVDDNNSFFLSLFLSHAAVSLIRFSRLVGPDYYNARSAVTDKCYVSCLSLTDLQFDRLLLKHMTVKSVRCILLVRLFTHQ